MGVGSKMPLLLVPCSYICSGTYDPDYSLACCLPERAGTQKKTIGFS